MAISKNKKRVDISLRIECYDLISKFADAMNMTKSEFIEDVCVAFINDVVKQQEARRKQAKKKEA